MPLEPDSAMGMGEVQDPLLLDHISGQGVVAGAGAGDSSGGWQTVAYPKRHRKGAAIAKPNAIHDHDTAVDVFRSVEQQAEERRRAAEARRRAAAAVEEYGAGAVVVSDEESGGEGGDAAGEAEGEAGVKVLKRKKAKKPRVTVAEAAAKIDAGDLAAHLLELTIVRAGVDVVSFSLLAIACMHGRENGSFTMIFLFFFCYCW